MTAIPIAVVLKADVFAYATHNRALVRFAGRKIAPGRSIGSKYPRRIL